MLTREDDIDVHALRRQGWTISAIARHLGRDRKTIRDYLGGDRQAGVRAGALVILSGKHHCGRLFGSPKVGILNLCFSTPG